MEASVVTLQLLGDTLELLIENCVFVGESRRLGVMSRSNFSS